MQAVTSLNFNFRSECLKDYILNELLAYLKIFSENDNGKQILLLGDHCNSCNAGLKYID